jgi:hypothetical protein
MSTHLNSPKFVSEVQSLVNGTVPSSDNSSIDTGLIAWNKLKTILDESTTGSAVFTNSVVSTYSLVYTTSSAYIGGVLSPNGDIHFIPHSGRVGQIIGGSGVVSTYSLVYSTVTAAYAGGVLAPNGDINFIPFSAAVGQKLNSSGVVSTYSLVYTTSAAYVGGVLGTNGDAHFIPCSANRGQKISSAGVVSTYSLVYTTSNAYYGGVLAPNGDINFIPFNATVGQKISSAGVVSTYSIVYTGGGGGFTPVAFVITSGTSRTVPTGATSMKAWVIGGGGGGTEGTNCNNTSECDGGYGGEAVKTYTVAGGNTVSYTVGAGGAGGSGGGAAVNGGNSTLTYGGVTVTGGGGTRGDSGTCGLPYGTGSGGDFNHSLGASTPYPADYQGRSAAVTLAGTSLAANVGKGGLGQVMDVGLPGGAGAIVLYFT